MNQVCIATADGFGSPFQDCRHSKEISGTDDERSGRVPINATPDF